MVVSNAYHSVLLIDQIFVAPRLLTKNTMVFQLGQVNRMGMKWATKSLRGAGGGVAAVQVRGITDVTRKVR